MMSVELNHTIVLAQDRQVSAEFLAGILGLEVGAPSGRFLPVETSNGVTLDFASSPEAFTTQHYAFLVADSDFDAAFERIQAAAVTYFADPRLEQAGQINRRHGGRGVYFLDPAGHSMELLTRPYGSG